MVDSVKRRYRISPVWGFEGYQGFFSISFAAKLGSLDTVRHVVPFKSIPSAMAYVDTLEHDRIVQDAHRMRDGRSLGVH